MQAILGQIIQAELASVTVTYPSGLKLTVEFPPPEDESNDDD
jgi:hypothetical protein